MSSPPLSDSERRVLEALWRIGEASRVELAGLLGLTKPAVTQIVRALVVQGLVEERAPRRGARGQPARPVALAARAALAVGVNFSHTYVDVGFVDLLGRPLTIRSRPIAAPTLKDIANTAFDLIAEMRADLGAPSSRLLGVGFAAPGDFLSDGGLLAHAYFPDLFGNDLRRDLAWRTDLPVFVENDGKACAIGELILGAGRAHRSFLVVHIGHGVGGGIVIDGRIYRGAWGNAGPIGVFWPLDRPRPSGQDLLETLNAAGAACRDFDQLEGIPLAETPALTAWVDRAAAQLEEVVPKIACVLDAEVVVLGGRLPPSILEAIVARIDLGNMFEHTDSLIGGDIRRPRLVASQLGPRAGVVGSAMLPIHRHLLLQV